MVNGIRASDPHGLNKGQGSKFRVGSRVLQVTPEECRKTHWSKHCEYNDKNQNISPKALDYKNHQVLSQKFRHLKKAG